ncbi:uncharacterized protein LOC130914491 isoform X2 [Corythoichthys intestinalis]|uniref:uncharacterized protein LOC130914491 isoform X2 n=1 Tax=Corythoichthys intestinalis TaxID=161448 RepID=UPI0025A619F7|nr:uncharacterized protein LOC130914491 isoform X2 [Corythoichthys intestinalis]
MDYLQPLIEFGVILILASHSNGQTWRLNVKQRIKAVNGTNLTIPCTFSYPPKYHMEKPQLFWKLLNKKSTFNTYDKDFNAFFYHPNKSFVEEKYQGKTTLVQNNDSSCTLNIREFMDEELKIYFRIIAKGENYSFIRKFVTISQSGQDVRQVTFSTGIAVPTSANIPQDERNRNGFQTIFIATFIPLAAVVVILTAGFLIWKKHTRKEKKKQESITLPDRKVVDEPVYINVQNAMGHTDTHTARGMDNKDNIYENVHHAK